MKLVQHCNDLLVIINQSLVDAAGQHCAKFVFTNALEYKQNNSIVPNHNSEALIKLLECVVLMIKQQECSVTQREPSLWDIHSRTSIKNFEGQHSASGAIKLLRAVIVSDIIKLCQIL